MFYSTTINPSQKRQKNTSYMYHVGLWTASTKLQYPVIDEFRLAALYAI